MLNSYLALEGDPATGQFHALLSGFADATRIINGVNRVRVRQIDKGIDAPLTIVPTYPDLPMEEVFPRPTKTKEPGVYIRQLERGRIVYFPFDLDRTFWEILDVDHGQLLRNAVLWASGEPQPLTVKGPGLLDVSVWRQKNSMTVHLVNLTNPMAIKGPVREIIPVSRQELAVKIPTGKRIAAVRLLVAEKELQYQQDGNAVKLEVPSIDLHEVVALDFLT